MNVERLFEQENLTAMAYAVGALRKASAQVEDDFDAAMLSRAASVCLFMLENISKELEARDAR